MNVQEQETSVEPLVICIDASNISSGGGLTHLIALLRNAKPLDHGISRVLIWASKATLAKIEDRDWLEKNTCAALEENYLQRARWQRKELGELSRKAGCNLLFVPGGSFATSFRPIVTMNRNLLPFEWKEMRRFGLSRTFLRLLLLRWSQTRSLLNADGAIFLTRYAKSIVEQNVGKLRGETAIIPHGVDRKLFQRSKVPRNTKVSDQKKPLRIVYVSIVNVYKHQWNVAEAVSTLRKEGYPVILDLIGPAYPPALAKLKKMLKRVDSNREYIHYLGALTHSDIQKIYQNVDIAVFASTCETFGQILTEYMSAGLPIACSNKSAMPELLGDAGMYFDPELPSDIANVLRELVISPELRAKKAKASYEMGRGFSWQQCATDTFEFLANTARHSSDQVDHEY